MYECANQSGSTHGRFEKLAMSVNLSFGFMRCCDLTWHYSFHFCSNERDFICGLLAILAAPGVLLAMAIPRELFVQLAKALQKYMRTKITLKGLLSDLHAMSLDRACLSCYLQYFKGYLEQNEWVQVSRVCIDCLCDP
jgi:hypothetical protein